MSTACFYIGEIFIFICKFAQSAEVPSNDTIAVIVAYISEYDSQYR